MELLDLEKVKPGQSLQLDGQPKRVAEVIFYEEDDAKWVNVVLDDGSALEQVPGKPPVFWREVVAGVKPAGTLPRSLSYKGENFKRKVEEGLAAATVRTAKGAEEQHVPYRVLQSASGRKIAVELWDKNELYIYVLEPTPEIVL